MQFETRKSNAGFILWGDIFELKALWTFIHRIQDESSLIKSDNSLLMDLAYEVRHAHDRYRRKGTRDWFGEDSTPIYGFDCFWPEILAGAGLLRTAMAYMPTITRNDQAVMYALESIIAEALDEMLPGTSESYLKTVARIAQNGEERLRKKVLTRTCYFLTLKPAQRKKHLSAIVDSMGAVRAIDNPLDESVFEEFKEYTAYPDHRF